MTGMGFRNNNAAGIAINDEPEGIYYVIDGTHYDNGCCFDYGNSSTNGRAVGTVSAIQKDDGLSMRGMAVIPSARRLGASTATISCGHRCGRWRAQSRHCRSSRSSSSWMAATASTSAASARR